MWAGDAANASPARIYVVVSRAGDAGAAVHAFIESDPAARLRGAFVHDIAGGPTAWFEIPPLDIRASPVLSPSFMGASKRTEPAGARWRNSMPCWAKAVGAKLSSVDTVNISPGAVYPCSSVGSEFAAICRGEFVRLHGNASYTPKSSNPSLTCV